MFGRKRKPLKEDLPENVSRRAKMIPTPDLNDWAENALYSAHRNLSSYRSRPHAPEAPMYFSEAKQSVEALLAVMREMEDRIGIEELLADDPKPPKRIIEQMDL
jgi:hypothetical protein